MRQDTITYKLWRIFYPLLLYLGIQMAVSFIGSIFISAYILMVSQPATQEEMSRMVTESSLRYTVLITGISAVITLPPALFFMRRDKKNMPESARRHIPWAAWPTLILAGISSCIGGNIIITLSQLQYIFDGYEQISQLLYSGSFIIQIIFIGIVVPVAEELIFRGLIYNRAKLYMRSTLTAMILSAFIFAVYHGNMVQGIYAFVIGFLMAYAYEKFSSILAPILFHICCNLPAVILQKLQISLPSPYSAAYIATGCVALTAFLFFVLHYLIQAPAFKKD